MSIILAASCCCPKGVDSGACCLDEGVSPECQDLSEVDCNAFQGTTWHGATSCLVYNCFEGVGICPTDCSDLPVIVSSFSSYLRPQQNVDPECFVNCGLFQTESCQMQRNGCAYSVVPGSGNGSFQVLGCGDEKGAYSFSNGYAVCRTNYSCNGMGVPGTPITGWNTDTGSGTINDYIKVGTISTVLGAYANAGWGTQSGLGTSNLCCDCPEQCVTGQSGIS